MTDVLTDPFGPALGLSLIAFGGLFVTKNTWLENKEKLIQKEKFLQNN